MLRANRRSAVAVVCLLSCVAACQRDLPLPAPPDLVVHPPEVASFEPAEAFAGAALAVTGKHFKGPAGTVFVRFGGEDVRPESVSDDGTHLRVRVPDDAGSGPLVVITPGGEAPSSGTFRYLGADRPRSSLVAGFKVLAATPAVFPLGPGHGFVSHLDEWGSARRILADDSRRDVTPRPVHAAAPVRDGVAAYLEGFASDPCPRELVVRDDTRVLSRTCLTVPTASWISELAFDGEGRRALAVGPGIALAIDFGSTPARITALDAPGAARSPAWVAGARFAFTEDASLRLVDDGTFGAPLPLPDPEDSGRAYVGASADRLFASTTGGLVVFDATKDPPVELHRVDTLGRWGAVGVSRDTSRVAIADVPGAASVIFLDGSATPARVTAIADVDVPRRPWPRSGDVFVIGHRGGWSSFAGGTGIALERGRVSLGLTRPLLSRRDPAADELLVSFRDVSSTLALDAADIGVISGSVTERATDCTATTPDLGRLFAFGAGELFEAVIPETPALALAAGTWTRNCQLRMTPDASALLLLRENPATRDLRISVHEVAGFPEERFIELGLTEKPLAWGVDRASRVLAQVTKGGVYFTDLAAMRARTGDIDLGALVPPAGVEIMGGAVGPDLIAVVYRVNDAPLVQLVRYDQTRSRFQRIPAGVPAAARNGAMRAFTFSPGSQRLWWVSARAQSSLLAHVAIDPDTLAISAGDPALPVSEGADDLYAFPDGETLVVTDSLADRIEYVR